MLPVVAAVEEVMDVEEVASKETEVEAPIFVKMEEDHKVTIIILRKSHLSIQTILKEEEVVFLIKEGEKDILNVFIVIGLVIKSVNVGLHHLTKKNRDWCMKMNQLRKIVQSHY